MTLKPNIVLIMADQLAARALQLYGNKVCKTPNLDRLAAEGTVFENCYSNNPLCVPSRASMLSGILTPGIHVYDNGNELASSQPTMAHHLRKAGYWTELCGKMHFIGPDQLHGFSARTVTDVYPANYQWISDWTKGPAFVPSGTALNGVVEAGHGVRTMQEDYDDEVENRCIQSIFDRAREPERNPFFEIVSFTSPHSPFIVSREYWDRYLPEDIDAPGVAEIPFSELDFHSKALFFAHGRHRHRITADHLRDARHAYYGMVSYIDDKVGRILDVLEKTAMRETTAVFFTSDHGEMLGERGMWFKQCFWEWSAHVPLIASVPGIAGGQRCGSVTSLIDLLPTFVDLAEGGDPGTDGASLLPLIQDVNAEWPDIAVSDYLAIGPCVPTRMVRKCSHKLMLTDGHPALLFDLDNDPDEQDNLAEQSNYADVLRELTAIAVDGWNPEALAADVIHSQKLRNFIASVPGDAPSWDFIARMDDDRRFVRRDGVDATKGRLRLPRVPEAPCDWPALHPQTVDDLMTGRRNIDDVLK